MSLRRLGMAVSAIIIVAFAVSALAPPSVDRVIIIGMINLVFVAGYYSFSGVSGVLSFGHMAFATIGGYVAGLVIMPVDQKGNLLPSLPEMLGAFEAGPAVAILLGGLAAALFGALVALPLSRISGLAAGLATAAVLLAIHDVARSWATFTRGARGLSPLPTSTTLQSAAVWLLIAVVIVAMYERSRWGKRLLASKDDLVAAEAVGISVQWERAISLVVSAFLTGIGGALFVLLLGAITPEVFFLSYTFLVIAMVVVGGIDSLVGSLIGGVLVTVVGEILRQVEQGAILGSLSFLARPGIIQVGLGLLLLGVLIWRPHGLASRLH